MCGGVLVLVASQEELVQMTLMEALAHYGQPDSHLKQQQEKEAALQQELRERQQQLAAELAQVRCQDGWQCAAAPSEPACCTALPLQPLTPACCCACPPACL